jgi:outer membrane protein TolC
MCQCLAAKHAPLADGLDAQRRQLEEKKVKKTCLREDKSAKQRAFQESMLLYSALEIRDQAAGTALEWYFQLAGAEAKSDLLNESLKEGRKTLQGIEGLKKQGLRLPAPIEEYQRQVVELQLQESQNQLAIEQLNSKLRQAIGQDSKVGRILPDPSTPLGMESPPDVEAAVKLGLQQRPQLLLLRSMIDNLDRDTLGSARSFLQVLSPLLAMSSPGPSCKLLKILGRILHIQPGQEDEVDRIRAQLTDYLHERERTVEAEIREAVYEIRAHRQATILARQAADSWEERIRNLEKQRAEGIRGVAELSKTNLDWYKARGEVVKEYIGWKIAVVKLKLAQGILPTECGYTECHRN